MVTSPASDLFSGEGDGEKTLTRFEGNIPAWQEQIGSLGEIHGELKQSFRRESTGGSFLAKGGLGTSPHSTLGICNNYIVI